MIPFERQAGNSKRVINKIFFQMLRTFRTLGVARDRVRRTPRKVETMMEVTRQ